MNNTKKDSGFNRHEFNLAFRDTIPIMAGYVFIGFAFGILMIEEGYPIWCPVVMSILIYSAVLEFAAVPLLLLPFDPLGLFFIGVMLNARHLFYGIPLRSRYQHMGKARPFLIFGLTDEVFSIQSANMNNPEKNKKYCIYVTMFGYFYWNLGTLLGSISGKLITADLFGLDFALTALFIVMLIEQSKNKSGKMSGITGIILSVFALLVFGKDNMAIASMILILVTLILGRRVFDNE